MKILKKISLVYSLQIFAVILLLGYAVETPIKNNSVPLTNGARHSKSNTQPLIIIKGDSILTGKAMELWHINTANDR